MTTLARNELTPSEDDLTSWVTPPASEHDPTVEDYVEGDQYVVRADLPGIDPDRDLELTLKDGVLRLAGERRAEGHHRRRAEIRYGTFERTVTVPLGTRPEVVRAEYGDGVLTISLPAVVASEQQPIPVTRTDAAPRVAAPS